MSSGKFKELKAYLQALPEALPLAIFPSIQRYIDILADNASNCKKTSESKEPQTLLTKLKDTLADTLAPRDDEWGRWE
jgi:hypothetical protein